MQRNFKQIIFLVSHAYFRSNDFKTSSDSKYIFKRVRGDHNQYKSDIKYTKMMHKLKQYASKKCGSLEHNLKANILSVKTR